MRNTQKYLVEKSEWNKLYSGIGVGGVECRVGQVYTVSSKICSQEIFFRFCRERHLKQFIKTCRY
jgi:hypothetical protein